MASFLTETEIEFDVTCDNCGEHLQCDTKEYRGKFELKVELCEHCIDKKNDEIEDIGVTHEEEKFNLEQEIKKLQDKIEALEIELTYNVLKNNEVMTELTKV